MKKVIIILMVFIALTSTIQAQWKQSLTGQTSLIRDISVVNNNVVWVKDQLRNSISITINGGMNWVTKALPSYMINAVGGFSAVNATTAYMIVSLNIKGVYKTTDSGDTWVKQSLAFNTSNPFPDFIYFWNENEGVAVGDAYPNQDFEIYTTSNGGAQWNQVSASNMPSGNYEWSWNSNIEFRVQGNNFYFITNTGRIFKSANKGLNWTVINTPISDGQNISFDFKDDLHGLISVIKSSVDVQLYSTSDGGINWTSINTTNYYSRLYCNPVNGVYFSTDYRYGLSYSKDNGNTWIIHSSFQNVGTGGIGISSTGKVFMGGWRYMYSSENYEVINLWVNDVKITGSNAIDVTYSENPDPVSSQNIANYWISYLENKVYKSLSIQSITEDATNKSVVHIKMQSDLPIDTVNVNIGNVLANNGATDFQAITKNIVLYNNSETIAQWTLQTSGTNETIIYPNPASDFITLNVDNMNYTGMTLNIYNSIGQLIHLERVIQNQQQINVRDLSNGIYIVEIKSKEWSEKQKLIIQR